jgi:uroporphyrinogen-III synthase
MAGSGTPVLVSLRSPDRADALDFAARDAGYTLTNIPVLDYAATGSAIPDGPYAGVIVTSVRALTLLDLWPTWLSPLPLYIVGAESARAATTLGMGGPCVTAPQVDDLIPLIPPAPLPYLYVCGDRTRVDLPAALGARGLEARAVSTYVTRPCPGAAGAMHAVLRTGDVRGVLFFSVAQAEEFIHINQMDNLDDRLRGISALCLSPRVLEYARHLNWAQTYTAATPDLGAMAALIRTLPRP